MLNIEIQSLYQSLRLMEFQMSPSSLVGELCSRLSTQASFIRPFHTEDRTLCNLKSFDDQGISSGKAEIFAMFTNGANRMNEWHSITAITAVDQDWDIHEWKSPYPDSKHQQCFCPECTDVFRSTHLRRSPDVNVTTTAHFVLANEGPMLGGDGTTTGYNMNGYTITSANFRILSYPTPRQVASLVPLLPTVIASIVSDYAGPIFGERPVRSLLSTVFTISGAYCATLAPEEPLVSGRRYMISVNDPEDGTSFIEAAGLGDWVGKVMLPFTVW